ncbi:MAG: hypothetical protein L0228_19310 [Planctomycetes bacterium]|nr:hypothetical protein [Planctomycetota bacterium]
MKKNIWRFSLLGLLMFVTLVAVVVAFAANYPWLALLITVGTAWGLLESGIVFQLSKPSVYLRHPFLVAGASLFTGFASFALSGNACITLWRSPAENWLALIPILLFGALGVFCLRPMWLLVKRSNTAQERQQTKER